MTLPTSTHESLKKLLSCPDLLVFIKNEWGSQNPQYRTLIQAELSTLIANPKLHTSISHCPGLGAIIAAPQPIGIDVEVFTRVEPRVVARISSAQEVAQSPNPASLWCAKEACFKALRAFNQPSVISKISVGDWKKIDSQFETFRFLNPEDFNSPSESRGAIINLGEFTCAFFIFLT